MLILQQQSPMSSKGVTVVLRKVGWLLAAIALLAGCRSGERVIARAEGVVVTATELQQAVLERYGAITLRELILQKLVEREAQQRGITVTESEITNALKQQSLPDTPTNRQRVRQELLLDKLAEAMVTVSEEEARRHFEQNRHLYNLPPRVRLRDITVESKENADALIQALRYRKGDNFAELARHFSINPVTRQRGGDMGLVPLNDLAPPLQQVVKRLKVGEFSEPIKLNGEWVIVKLEARYPAEQKTFEQVREQVIAHLKQQKVWQLRMQLPNQLWQRAKVEILDTRWKNVLTR